MKKNVCKICRRYGQKLMLKGEKCFSPKCPFIKRPFPPGQKSKRRRGHSFSEFAKELKEKQKLKNIYGLSEKKFSSYIKAALAKRSRSEDASLILLRSLEYRLDNVVFRMGLARSRKEADKLVTHRHFLVNQKPVNIPSFQVNKGDKISLKEIRRNKALFKNAVLSLKNYQSPPWLSLNKTKLEAKVIDQPTAEDIGSAVDISAIFEFYSR